MNQPHIILIITDQQKASATGCYGNTLVHTPTMDKLAAKGLLYEQAHAPSTICTPCRTSIMTGVSPLVHRVLCHQNHAPVNLQQLPEILADAGYCTVAAGHYESNRSLDRGWAYEVEMTGSNALLSALNEQYTAGSREVGWSAGMHALSPHESHAAVLNREVFSLLDRLEMSQTPLFLQMSYIEPHPPYFAPQGYLDTGTLQRIPVPPRGNPESTPEWHTAALRDYRTSEAMDQDIRKVIGAYYAMTSYVDGQIGHLLHYLGNRGILDEAWVIFCSDHGDYAGEKGMFTKTETPYECLTHVPLVICGPSGRWRSGERVAELVDLTDLFATVLSLAHCKIPEYSQSRDLTGRIPSKKRTALFSAVGEYHGHLGTTMPWGLPLAGRHPGLAQGARNTDYLYIRDPDYGDEAYDLHIDQHELCNLFQNDPLSVPAGVRALQAALDAWEQECAVLFNHLGVQPGDRNFDEKLDTRVIGAKVDTDNPDPT